MTKERTYQPPSAALKFFRWYCRPDRLEELEGDLEELFALRLNKGQRAWKVKLFFWWNVIRCYKSYAKSKTQTNTVMFSLFKSYFKLALRHSWKNRWSVAINVVGLGLSLSMCVFVYTLYAYNIEFDSFYEDTDDIYRIHAMTFENGLERRNEMSPLPMDDKLRNEISGIKQVSSYIDRRVTVKKGSDYFSEFLGAGSDDFFEMFDIPLWYGSFEGFGEQPIVYLTQTAAKRYFGDEVALGETLTLFITNDRKLEVTVGGVFEKIPLNSSFGFDVLMNEGDYMRTLEISPDDWSNNRYTTHFIRADANQLETITAGINRLIPLQNENHQELKMSEFELVPFRSPLVADDILWRNNVNARLRPEVRIIFTVLASMVFFTACFNLANTSMALIAKRLKEIGIRKTLGSANGQILIQFLFEMGFVAALAFVIALSTANITSSAILGLFQASFPLQMVNLTGMIAFVVGFLIFTTIVAGLLPALYAWKFQPAAIMRKSVKLKGINWLNKTLTVAQYAFSIAVLAAGVTFSQNSSFLNQLDLGYQNDDIIDLNLGSAEHYATIKQEVDQIAGVTTAGTVNNFANFGRLSSSADLQVDTSHFEVRKYAVGVDYLEFMGVTITSGRSFIEGSEVDQNQSILVSQSFADSYFDGKDPVNEVVKIDDERRTIVGVTADIIDDVYEDSEFMPTIITMAPDDKLSHLLVKVSQGDMGLVEERLKGIWSDHIEQPYGGKLQKDIALGDAGRDTRNLQKIFLAMAMLGGFLSIVGIFSLAKLNVARRIKEISIRKVMGASIKEIIATVNRSFTFVLLIAMFVGCGLGYFVADAVLAMIYKYYVDVSLFTSLLSGGFIVLLSAVIITAAIMGPANANPVVGLRDE